MEGKKDMQRFAGSFSILFVNDFKYSFLKILVLLKSKNLKDHVHEIEWIHTFSFLKETTRLVSNQLNALW